MWGAERAWNSKRCPRPFVVEVAQAIASTGARTGRSFSPLAVAMLLWFVATSLAAEAKTYSKLTSLGLKSAHWVRKSSAFLLCHTADSREESVSF